MVGHLERLRLALADIRVHVRAGPAQRATPARYRFEITGSVALRTDIVVEGSQASLEPVDATQADVTFCCAPEPFIFLLYGRLSLPEAIAAGRITADGDTGLIPAFAQSFRGV